MKLQMIFVAWYDLITKRKGETTMNETIKKEVIVNKLLMERNKWLAIKGHDQDVTQDNFIDNVLLVYEWIISDVEKM